jgi:hypothetical protein
MDIENHRSPKGERTFSRSFSEVPMKKRMIEFLLPLAAEGVKERKLQIDRTGSFVRPVKMKATTTCATMSAEPGDVLHFYDDDKEIVTFTIPEGMPDRFDLSVKVGAPCHVPPTAVVPTPPLGEQRVQDPVALVQTAQVVVVKATPPTPSLPKPIEEMSTAEKLAAGLKPNKVDGKIVWS